jgi:hypothetical protein
VVALDRDTQHLAELAGRDDQPHAGLEAGQHRRGDEVGQEPRRSSPAAVRITPTSRASWAAAAAARPGSPAAPMSARAPAVRMEMVEVELTLSGRELPVRA